MAHSSHGTVVESSSVHFVFCSSDLFRFSFFVWGIRPELFAVLSFLIFCFFLFSSSFWGGVLGTAVIIIVLLLGTFFGMTNTGQMSAVQKNWNKWSHYLQ